MNERTIRRLQERLRLIAQYGKNMPVETVDGIYGEDTANAVRAFQQLFGLTPTGEMNYETWTVLDEVYALVLEKTSPPIPIDVFADGDFVLKKGDESPLVVILEIMLNTLAEAFDNLIKVQPTGKYGEGHSKAVSYLQSINSIEPSGEVDKLTWNVLSRLYNGLNGQVR